LDAISVDSFNLRLFENAVRFLTLVLFHTGKTDFVAEI